VTLQWWSKDVAMLRWWSGAKTLLWSFKESLLKMPSSKESLQDDFAAAKTSSSNDQLFDDSTPKISLSKGDLLPDGCLLLLLLLSNHWLG
jgi:hypothetical protein